MTASLTVLSGPLAGTRLDLDDSADEVLVGSDPDCGLALDVPGVSPIHARLWLDSAGLTVYDTRSPYGLFVNDARVEGEASLRDGDVLWLGTPGDDHSVMIQCRVPGGVEALLAVDTPAAPETSVVPGMSPDAGRSPLDDLEGLVADVPEPPEVAPVPATAPPAAQPPAGGRSAVPPPSGDLFFMDEPPALPAAAPPVPASHPVPAERPTPAPHATPAVHPLPTGPPTPAAVTPAVPTAGAPDEPVFFEEEEPFIPPPSSAADAPGDAGEDLFFVEEPAAVPAPVEPPPLPVRAAPAVAAPAPAAAARAPRASVPPPPPVAPAAKAPAAAPPPPPEPAAGPRGTPAILGGAGVTAASGPVRVPRRPGPTPPPSAMPDVEDTAAATAPERPRGVAARAPAARGRSAPPLGVIAGGLGLVLALAVAGVVVLRSLSAPTIESITPARVGLGQSVVITGAHFAPAASDNVVRFGDKPGRVVQASDTRLQVEIPEVPAASGRDTAVAVVVTVGGRESKPASVGVFLAPRIHGIAPTVAMPGDEVVLAGGGWGAGARVQFGGVTATVLDSSPTSLRVRVPALEGAPGREFPVTVTMGADASNPAPFLIGHLPLVISVAPNVATPGDLVTLSGRGFEATASDNDVRVGGARALVTRASGSEVEIIVPRVAQGESVVEVRVPAAANVGQGTLSVSGGPDPIDFRFVAEPFEDKPGHDHAVLSTGLGPAFVLSGGGGRSAAERAAEAQRRLNEAAATLRGSLDADVRARGLDGSPALVLAGKDVPLLEVTLDDAAAYEEDWTGLRGRGGEVTPARLATWWEAVARDLVLVLVRGERPHFAADLAPEGRVFADVHAAARKSVATGVPRQVVADARPAVREALRTAGLRVPAAVKGPSSTAGTPTPPEPTGPALRLEGRWSGTETESGRLKYVSANFAGEASTFTYERALSLTVPLLGLQQQKTAVRFSVQTGTGPRHYQGRWDGQKLSGTISVDPGGQTPVGTFELAPR